VLIALSVMLPAALDAAIDSTGVLGESVATAVSVVASSISRTTGFR
jgi:hypothetical protein